MRSATRWLIASSCAVLAAAPFLAQGPAAQSWFELSPSGPLPPIRTTHTAVYDDANDRMTVFGGYSLPANCAGYAGSGTFYGDVWVLAGAAGFSGSPQWTEITPAGPGPGARWNHSAVYDPSSNRMIVYSGNLDVGDVWILDHANGLGGAATWTQLATVGGPSRGRWCHSAVYDQATNRMIVFGGVINYGPVIGNDVWVLDHANGLGGTPTWTQLAPTGTLPPARGDHSAVYDAANNRMIVFGGGNPGPALNDVWVLEHANGLGGTPAWQQLAPDGTPPAARQSAAAFFDAATNRMMIFSGVVSGDLSNDTWLLHYANGLGGTPAWTELTPAVRPPARRSPSAVYDSGNRMVIFGGDGYGEGTNDTWVMTNPNGLPEAPPSVEAGADQLLEIAGGSAAVVLDGSATDVNGDVLSYEWRDGGGSVVGSAPTVSLALGNGQHVFTLVVTDSTGLSGSDSVRVGVRDTTVAVPMDFSNPADLPPGASCGSPSSCTIAGGTYNGTTFNVPAGVTLTVAGARPLVVSAGNIVIAGTLSANAGAGGGGGGGLIPGQNGGSAYQLDGTPVANGGQAAPCCTFEPPYYNLLGGGGGGGNGGGGGSGGAPGAGFGGGPTGPGGNGVGARVAGGTSVSGDQPGNPGQGGAGGGNGAGGPSSGYGTQPGGAGGGGVIGSQGDPSLAVFAGGGGGGHGGCSGEGCTWGGVGGAGGGAIRLTSSASIAVSGTISANGGGGTVTGGGGYGGGGGGGAGGTIWLTAPLVANTGAVQAVGGTGGGGGGGYGGGGGGAAGRIRVDTTAGVAPSGSFVPAIGYLGVLPALASIEVQPPAPSVVKTLSQQFTPIGHFSDGSSRVLGSGGGAWIARASMGMARRLLTGASSGGLVYAFGGCSGYCYQPPYYTSTAEATRNEVYNPATDTWTVKAPIPYVFFLGASAAPGNGRLYILGGHYSATSTYEYDPATDTWSEKAPMPTGRAYLGAIAVDGKIYAIGGNSPSAVVEMYDPLTNAWTAKAPMPTARHSFGIAELGGKVHVIGGSPDCCGNGQTSVHEVYDPATDTWATKAPLPNNVAGVRAASLNGKVYAFGGYNIPGGTVTAYPSVYEYDPATDTWRSMADMPVPRQWMVIAEAGGRIYMAGGADGSANARSTHHAFTPPEVAWSSSDVSTATIDQSGMAQAIDVGSAVITAASSSVAVSGTATMSVVLAPIAVAGPDQVVEATSPAGATATLDGSASSHPGGLSLAYEWRDESNTIVGTSAVVSVPVPLGPHVYSLTVTDSNQLTNSDLVVVTVVDTTAPLVLVVSPNGGEHVPSGAPLTVQWTASDNTTLNSYSVLVSFDGGLSYSPVPGCSLLPSTATSCSWPTPGPGTITARVRVAATDAAALVGADSSDGNFAIAPSPGISLDFSSPSTLAPGAACSSSASCTIQGGDYVTTTFSVPAGVTVQVVGNRPLVVTAGTATIAGTLSASNGSGGGGAAGYNAYQSGGGGYMVDGSQVADGGQATPCCNLLGGGGGGGNGGGGGGGGSPGTGFGDGPGGAGGNGIGDGVAGGAPIADAVPGNPGQGGAGGGNGSGGGATCCGVQPGGDGGGGVTGSQGDPDLTVFAGGGGGGHGGCSGNGCTWGGRGGGGGGAIKIAAATMAISGSVVANGGSGTVSSNGGYGGGGGGGAGGTIWLSAYQFENTGTVHAIGGNGGGGGGGYGGGGGGGAGRIRVDTSDGGTPVGTFLPAIGYTGIVPDNPVPHIDDPVVPVVVSPGTGTMPIIVRGANFMPGIGGRARGVPRATTFLTSHEVQIELLTNDLATAATLPITLVNPAPGGGVSNAANFHVVSPNPGPRFNPAHFGLGPIAQPFAVSLADFDGDGDLDLAGAAHSYDSVTVFANDGSGAFAPVGTFATGQAPYGMAAADVNGDGAIDLVTATHASLSVHLGNGDGTFGPPLSHAVPDGPSRLAIADLDRDGRLDLVTANGQPSVSILRGRGDGTFDPPSSVAVGGGALRGVVAADLDGDGILDLAVAGAIDTAVFVLIGHGDGTFSPPEAAAVGVRLHALAAGDLDGDGDLDLAAASGNNSSLSVLLGAGDGTFGPVAHFATGYWPEGVALGDFDADGRLDAVTADTGAATLSLLAGNGDGTFGAPSPFATPTAPRTIVAGDVDGDGRLDAATANSLGNNLSVFRNSANEAPEADAGADQSDIQAGAEVTLDGSASSDPDGDTLSFAWTQVAGPPVSSTESGAILTFTPTLAGTYEFSLVVGDPEGLTDSDTVVIVVVDTVLPAVTVARPNASGEKVFAGTPFVIAWNASDNGELGSFDVSVSVDGGVSYSPVAGCTGVAGSARSCAWNAPGPLTTKGRIRVTAYDAAGNRKADASDANFSIVSGAASITVTAPNTTVEWPVGLSRQVTWSHNLGPNSWVKIEVTRDNGTTWELVRASIKNTGSTSGAYAWKLTGPTTTRARVRVSWLNGPVSDQSNVTFKIVNPMVAVTQPNTSVQWPVGGARTIGWTHNLGTTASVRIELSRNGGADWEVLAASVANSAATTGTFRWVVTGPLTAQARVRVTFDGPPAASDASDATFTIADPFITMAAPGALANWVYGSARTVTWSTNLGSPDRVNVLMSADGGETFPYVLAANVTASNKTVAVTVPVLPEATTRARLRVAWAANPAVQGANPADFAVGPPVVTVTSPNLPSVVWSIGSRRTVTWSHNLGPSENVRIALSLDGGATFPVVLSSGTPSDGSHEVTVQTAWATSQARVRVTRVKNPTASDTSNDNFRIQ